MTQQEREEIEKAIGFLIAMKWDCFGAEDYALISKLIQFARRQLSLRVDGEKLAEELTVFVKCYGQWAFDAGDPQDLSILEAMVLECLTTGPLPTES